ncbi:hypothetical protein AWENTII_010321 [Aspergillus wentii]
MDLIHKWRLDRDDVAGRKARRQSAQSQLDHHQAELNALLGSFGTAQNDHPDRRASNSSNRSTDIQKAVEAVQKSPN